MKAWTAIHVVVNSPYKYT